ncbi:nitrite reductase small subunit NirD [Actinomadura roseirufa]|uniref:nitrite reductase small subunit NirD n=1 Tax=Actinomadura roseirufa TaxID=2094049 RepID=UPI0010410CD5|nr:nitrite reductase small subunit NirD [Actinomadura roseirufa]
MTATPDVLITRAPAGPRGDGSAASRWTGVCDYADLVPGRGGRAVVGGTQIAIFRTLEGGLYALSDLDPFSGAYVLSQGTLGIRGGAPTVASPRYGQVFDLRDGACLDDPRVVLPVFPIRLAAAGDRVEVAVPDGHRQ